MRDTDGCVALQWNREPLWPSSYANSSNYQMIATLNKVSHSLQHVIVI
jgi:hypothetical protein